MRHTRTIALSTVALGASLLASCGEMKPRPVADSAPPPAAPPAERATRDPNAPDQGHNSASTLGKARDAAMRGVRAHDKRQEEIGKQADDIFKDK